jgi:hypothetical protein
MKYWIGCLIIVLLLLIFLTSNQIVERFTPAEQTAFIKMQQNQPVPNSLYIDPGLNISRVNQALNTADGTVVDYTNRFEVDPLLKLRSKDETTCRLARHPRQLTRAAAAKSGCGWWYVPDGISIGTLGTITGPSDRSIPQKYPTGQWFWNLDDAARMEDIKLCKRITLCEAVTPDCGWCESQGHAIPVNSNGSVKYPNDDSGSCSTTPFTGGSCPAPVAPPSEPILDNNGNVVGERTPPAPVFICAPRNGKLTRECLLALAKARGFTSTGSLYQMIARGSSPTEGDRVAMDILAKANLVVVTPELWGGGNVSINSALTAYGIIGNATVTGKSKQIQQAARYLAVGGEEVNLCDIGEDTLGPFSSECLGRAFREAGCQASGAAYPRNNSAVVGQPWGNVKQSYRSLAGSMYSTDAFVQADAVKNCLGTSLDLFVKV